MRFGFCFGHIKRYPSYEVSTVDDMSPIVALVKEQRGRWLRWDVGLASRALILTITDRLQRRYPPTNPERRFCTLPSSIMEKSKPIIKTLASIYEH